MISSRCPPLLLFGRQFFYPCSLSVLYLPTSCASEEDWNWDRGCRNPEKLMTVPRRVCDTDGLLMYTRITFLLGLFLTHTDIQSYRHKWYPSSEFGLVYPPLTLSYSFFYMIIIVISFCIFRFLHLFRSHVRILCLGALMVVWGFRFLFRFVFFCLFRCAPGACSNLFQASR